MMPRLSGPELVRRLAAHPGLTGVPVVLMSAAHPVGLDRDGAAFLPKPFDLGRLLALVASE